MLPVQTVQGMKMEAICYEPFVEHFNNQIQTGAIYLFKHVQFESAEVQFPFKARIQSEFIIILRRQTEIQLVERETVVPTVPHRFTQFSTVYGLRNKMLAGTKYWLLGYYVYHAISEQVI